MVRKSWVGLCFSLFSLAFVAPAAGALEVEGARVWTGPDSARLVFDLSGSVQHNLFVLPNPDRVVIDLEEVRLGTRLSAVDLSDSPIERIRSGVRDGTDLRIVLDLKERVKPEIFALPPNREYGHRLVVDLEQPGASSAEPVVKKRAPQDGLRNVVVAIDAGHGGEDPGARGPRGTREKDVVLAIARRLADLLEEEPGMEPVMIRKGDYYIGLRERIAKAREAQADLFVSIHADAFHDPRAHGSSVYTLSQRGASTEAARWLAESENDADLIGGVSLGDKDNVLASVLLDLAQTATNEASYRVASNVLGGLKRIGDVHKPRVQRAGFVVLKSPDIPSLLVETAFISNPAEERKLRSPSHQQRLARAMVRGVRRFFSQHPPPGTFLAERRRHIIARGETLSAIAQEYHVSVNRLKSANDLSGDKIRVGQVLEIPSGSDG